jgi:hypothetical protein
MSCFLVTDQIYCRNAFSGHISRALRLTCVLRVCYIRDKVMTRPITTIRALFIRTCLVTRIHAARAVSCATWKQGKRPLATCNPCTLRV